MIEYRKAVTTDVPAIHRLVNEYAIQGVMLRRTLLSLYENMRDFAVAVQEGEIVAVGALHVMWHDLAEIRSLAVQPRLTGQGIGRGIVKLLLQEAEQMALKRVFALTYQRDFFEKLNFRVIKKEKLPQKVWSECINCHKFNSCDEIAMIHYLVEPDDATNEQADAALTSMDIPHWVRE